MTCIWGCINFFIFFYQLFFSRACVVPDLVRTAALRDIGGIGPDLDEDYSTSSAFHSRCAI